MTIKLDCKDYGFECDFALEGEQSLSLIEKLKEHFDQEHGIDYTIDALIQMIVNRGIPRSSILNE